MTLARRAFVKLLGSGLGMLAGRSFSQPNSNGKIGVSMLTTRKFLIAHRGASAYAPEHTIESYELALNQAADYVEQDLQITRDSVLVCLHDLTLERTTDVKQVFPERFRQEVVNGTSVRHWYVSDFALAELKQLDAGSWFNAKFKGARIPTFQEAIDLVRGKAGLYPETKAPEVYGQRGFDMEDLLMKLLSKNGLDTRKAAEHTPVIIQSFSPESLKKLFSAVKTNLPLVLLIDDAAPGQWLTKNGLTTAKQFAAGIGPAKGLLDKSLVSAAHDLGLTVTPYTFRSSNSGKFRTVRDEMSYYLYDLGVDALFTDNPDMFPRAPVRSE